MPALHHRSQPRTLAVALTVAVGLASLAACSTSDSNGNSIDKGRNGGSDGARRTGQDDSEGKVVGSGTRFEATIRRTTDGVPHITGKTVADAAFGQGYAGGQDRTCDLADQVVKIKGERARWFGAGEKDANLDSDVQWLGIGIFDRAAGDWGRLGGQAKELFQAYVDGWNTHLAEVGVNGIAGWCKGEKWVHELKPVEVYAYARSIALNASGGPIGAYIPGAAPPATTAARRARQPAPLRPPDHRAAGRPAGQRRSPGA